MCVPVALAHTRATKVTQEPMDSAVETAGALTRGSHKQPRQVAYRRNYRPTNPLDALFDPTKFTKNFFSNSFSMLQPFGGPQSMSPFGNFGSFNMPSAPQMSLDMYSDSKAYHLSASVPGVKKEDISVRVDDGMLIIQAERKVERKSDKPPAKAAASGKSKDTKGAEMSASDSSASEPKDSEASVQAADKSGSDVQVSKDKTDDMEFHFMESSYGLVERSIALPEDCDVDKLSAKYENGVLEIDLPRLAEPKPSGKTINIE